MTHPQSGRLDGCEQPQGLPGQSAGSSSNEDVSSVLEVSSALGTSGGLRLALEAAVASLHRLLIETGSYGMTSGLIHGLFR
jgi:hypothetical protein